MTIRPATRQDAENLAYVASTTYIQTFGKNFNFKDELDAELEQNRSEKYFIQAIATDCILVAEVGYVQFGEVNPRIRTKTDRNIQLRRLYVLADFHGKGLGSKLVDAMLNHDLMREVENVYLEAWKKNEKAINLYLNYGFEFTGQEIPFLEKGKVVDCDNVMVKVLSSEQF